jgi:hypothetical protein
MHQLNSRTINIICQCFEKNKNNNDSYSNFPRAINNSHAVDYSRDRRQSIPKMPHFQTAITRQFDGDNSFFKLLIERTTLPEYDGVSFI